MPRPPITIYNGGNDAVTESTLNALRRTYTDMTFAKVARNGGNGIDITAVRNTGRPISRDWIHTLVAFAHGAEAGVRHGAEASVCHGRPAAYSGCEFCCPMEGDPFVNRPLGADWT